MILGLLGKKIGMSQYIHPNGTVVPVTVLEVGPCTITQVKTMETDGYEAVQIGFEPVKKANQPKRGHLEKSGLFRHLREVRADSLEGVMIGQQLKADFFQPGELLTASASTRGLGFQGVVKRHGFRGGPRTHGQSDRLRGPGAIGSNTFPARVFKGKRMAGHMGNERVTIKNLEVVKVDQERNLLLLKGGVPGGPQSLVLLRKTGKGGPKAQ